MIRIGIDVGGTNTDAVLMDGQEVLHAIKTPTTADVTSGVLKALEMVLEGRETGNVAGVMIGTTHFTNAIVQRRELAPTAIVRLGLPATQSLPPMVSWPDDLRQALGGHIYLAHGGWEFDRRPLSPLDPDELRGIALETKNKGVKNIAISAVFSPINTSIETDAATIIKEVHPDAEITVSSEIGRVGLLERKNAAIINACLHDLGHKTVRAFRVGDVRTNFRMPDVLSIGLGGGSLIGIEPLSVGPVSIGFRLPEKALVFGGDTLTASDIAVAAGMAQMGDASRVAHLEPALVEAVTARIEQMIAEVVDRMLLTPEPVPVIVVGGGSVLVKDQVAGLVTIKPKHFAVANAVGAAIAQISGEVDRVYSLASQAREAVLEEAKKEAIGRAVKAGADPSSVEIVEVEDVPLAYLPGNATRVRIKAVGDLRLG